MREDFQQILTLIDAGHTPADLIRTGLSRDQVYRVLRTYRPGRERCARTPTSIKPAQICALYAAGLKDVERIATICECSTAYVYKHLRELVRQGRD